MLSVEYPRHVPRNWRSHSSIASRRSYSGDRFQRRQRSQIAQSRPFSWSKAIRRPTGKLSTTL
jgi:hypothetical protein